MNWATAENAIVSWLKIATGLPVVWSDQDGPKLPLSFVRVKVLTLTPVGQDETQQTQDLTRTGNGTTTVGTEIELTATGLRSLVLSIQAHTGRVLSSPVALLSRVQTALRLESVRTALIAAGLSPYDIGTVRDLTALVDDSYEGRAVVECSFYMTEELSDFATFIEAAPVEMYTGPPDSGTCDDIDI